MSAADPRHGASYLGDSQSEKIRERQNQRERQRDRERQTERNRERQTETDRDDKRETESEREAERDRETEGPSYHAAPWPRVRVTSCRAECLECRRSISPLPEQPTCGRQRGRKKRDRNTETQRELALNNSRLQPGPARSTVGSQRRRAQAAVR